MVYPVFKHKQLKQSVTTAKPLIKDISFYKADRAVLIFHPAALNHVKKVLKAEPVPWVFGKMLKYQSKDKTVLIAHGFGAGAPAAAILCEYLAATGVKEIVAVGSCGAIADNLKAGDILTADSFINDNGVSYHYCEDAGSVKPDKEFVKLIASAIGGKVTTGKFWSTDALFKETSEEITFYKNSGVLAVEMEGAGIVTVCNSLNVKAAVICAVSDIITSQGWVREFNNKKFLNALALIAQAMAKC